jgi:hypothetical protein
MDVVESLEENVYVSRVKGRETFRKLKRLCCNDIVRNGYTNEDPFEKQRSLLGYIY